MNELGSGNEIELHTADGARARLSTFGAQVLSWQPLPSNEEQLFLSSRAKYDGRTAIRGGIPILFPYFGRREAKPSHGFARLCEWRVVSVENGAQRSTAVLTLSSSDFTKRIWPHEFVLTLTVTLEERSLAVEMQVLNSGSSTLSFSGGLHSYFSLDDVSNSRIVGLSGCEYLEGGERRLESPQSLKIDRAIDRIYLCGGTRAISLTTPKRRVEIMATGFKESVVWNPWREGASQLDDLNDHDYLAMVCIESVMAYEPVVLAAGETWSGGQQLMAIQD